MNRCDECPKIDNIPENVSATVGLGMIYCWEQQNGCDNYPICPTPRGLK